MTNYKTLARRFIIYIFGLFIMTMGIALSVKSDLGVSPVSSIPYTITCVFGMEMGNATILFHAFLVFLQVIILRRDFKIYSILQIAAGIVFGKFTTLCNYLAGMLPAVDNLAVRLIMVLISTVLIAVRIFFYLPANIMPLAGEGAMQAISDKTPLEFSRIKICFDLTMVLASLVTCLIVLHTPGSVGAGTIIAAVLVGFNLGIINKKFGAWRDKLLCVKS